MKKITVKKAADLIRELKAGTHIQGITARGYGVGHIYYHPLDRVLCWEHYGSSANKATAKDLKWIIENIFGDCVDIFKCEYSDYHVNWVPVENPFGYKGIDRSYQHPNVYGL